MPHNLTKHGRAIQALVRLRGAPVYGAHQDRTAKQKEQLLQDLEALIDRMQDTAEFMEMLGANDAFAILDTAAERLRELTQ